MLVVATMFKGGSLGVPNSTIYPLASYDPVQPAFGKSFQEPILPSLATLTSVIWA